MSKQANQQPNNTGQEKYGMSTALSMIIGIVIGSGIFFKSDDILAATGGNILLGVFIFIFSAFSIIFGGLTIAQIAHRTNEPGGIITYAELVCNKTTACVFGWLLTFIYFPTLITVVGWVSTTYIGILFGFTPSLELKLVMCLGIILCLYVANTLSYRLGGYIQNAATIIKLIPLIGIGFAGFIWGNPDFLTHSAVPTAAAAAAPKISWTAAIPPVAFAFDGWIVSTSIAHEIKNSKRNLPIALTISSIFILIVYIIYFTGISLLLSPAEIIAQQDHHVEAVAIQLLGAKGAKVILLFVVISILGTLNGLILGSSRMPYSLALHKMLPGYKKIEQVNPKYSISLRSVVISFLVSLIWVGFHFLNQKVEVLNGNDVSEIAIVTMYILYIILYVRIMYKNHQRNRQENKAFTAKNLWWGYLVPSLAVIGAGTIVYGGMKSPFFWFNNLISIALIICAILYYRKTIRHPAER